MYENDYIMKMIKAAMQVIKAIVKGRDAIESSIDAKSDDIIIGEDQLLEIMVNKYVSEGDINKAENLIFEALESRKSSRNLETALSFYDEISKWDEEKLIKYNFSKEEILDGLNIVRKMFDK
ncbi:DUF6483 family protein [Clostridium sp. YIM B02551]|uniref:DUF6483 family protein n=1 Tax=Clostridium sp. YIM B02551 TaxID=2910679 RepID=UPI001EEC842F|nr:DUF6483 family protein [Clostridium sp. YIM B02551]